MNSVRMPHHSDIGSQLEPVEHDPRRLLHLRNIGIKAIRRGADQHGVVDRCADLDTALGANFFESRVLGAGLFSDILRTPISGTSECGP